MGIGAQTCQETLGGNQRVGAADIEAPRAGKARRRTRKKDREAIPPLGEAFAKNLLHFFPEFSSWLLEFSDHRCQGKTDYSKELCIWSVLAMFIQGLGSRNQYNHEAQADLYSGILLANLNTLAGTQNKDIPHGDTVADYLSILPYQEVEFLSPKMVERLIRMRKFEHVRLFGRYLIAMDASRIWSFATRHCEHCLTQTHDGKTTYYHMVMEAKLVTPDGLALSTASEFVENTDPSASRQDCELKAIIRLAKKVKGLFPRLPIMLLLDALHANKNTFTLCNDLEWDWIITFKKGSLPTAWDEFCRLKDLAPENVLERDVNNRYQHLSWVNDLQHEGHHFSAFDCLTYNAGQETQYFAWITNLKINSTTVSSMANQGGRTRWKIENQGFKEQKCHGYELEHVFSQNENAGKNYYLLLQVAHNMVQLLLHGSLAGAFKASIRTLKNFFIRMADSLRHCLIAPIEQIRQSVSNIQIRLNTS